MRLSKQTYSFIILMLLTVGATYGAIIINRQLSTEINQSQTYQNIKHNYFFKAEQGAEIEAVDTSAWKDYADAKYPVKFKYPSTWEVKSTQDKTLGVYEIMLKPSKNADPISIYVTKDTYFAVDGLPLTQVKINDLPGVNCNDYIIGLNKGSNYYTFDIGQNTQLKNVFFGILHTVQING